MNMLVHPELLEAQKDLEKTHTFLRLEYGNESGLEFINLERGMKYLKSLSEKTKAFIAKARKLNESIKFETFDGDKYDLYRIVEDTNYANLREATVFVPTTLSCTYIELMQTFDEHQATGIHLDTEHLQPFSQWLVGLIGDVSQLSKLTPTDVIKFDSGKDTIDAFTKCFEGKEGLDRLKYGEVIRRNKDWKEITDIASRLSEEVNKKSLHGVEETLDHCIKMVDTIIDLIQRDTTIQVSKPVLAELSNNVYNLAKLVSINSLYLTKLTATFVALKDNKARLEEINQ